MDAKTKQVRLIAVFGVGFGLGGLGLGAVGCGAAEDGGEVVSKQEAIINGTDDRVEISNAPAVGKEVAKAVFAMVYKGHVLTNADGTRAIKRRGTTNLCSDQAFSGQIDTAQCTAFLIAPNLALTANHCLTAYTSLESQRLVLGYNDVSGYGPNYTNLPAANVFTPTAVVATADDAAIIRLDHDASPLIKPLRISQTDFSLIDNPYYNQTPVAVLGSPLGFPTKYAGNAAINGVGALSTPGVFKLRTFLDAMEGNSGGAMINPTTGEVYGVFTEGDADLQRAPSGTCDNYVRCDPKYAGCTEAGRTVRGLSSNVAPAGTPLDASYSITNRLAIGAPGVIPFGNPQKELIVFTGDDQKVYWRRKDSSDTITAPVELPGGMTTQSGVATTTYRPDIYAFVLGNDGRIYYNIRYAYTGNWSTSWMAIPAPTSGQFSPPMQLAGAPTAAFMQVSSGNIASDDLVVTARDTSNRLFQNVYRFSMNMSTYTPTYVGWSGWSLVASNATAPSATLRASGAGGVTFTPKTDGTISRRTYSVCSSTTSGCLGPETAITQLPATKDAPTIIPVWGNTWLVVRAGDNTAQGINIDASGNVVAGSTFFNIGGGFLYSAPVGSSSFGTWWLYSTAADHEITRF